MDDLENEGYKQIYHELAGKKFKGNVKDLKKIIDDNENKKGYCCENH